MSFYPFWPSLFLAFMFIAGLSTVACAQVAPNLARGPRPPYRALVGRASFFLTRTRSGYLLAFLHLLAVRRASLFRALHGNTGRPRPGTLPDEIEVVFANVTSLRPHWAALREAPAHFFALAETRLGAVAQINLLRRSCPLFPPMCGAPPGLSLMFPRGVLSMEGAVFFAGVPV